MTIAEMIGLAGVLVQSGIWLRLGKVGQKLEDVAGRVARLESWRDTK